MSYLDKETNVTEQEESCNEIAVYQELLNNDPDYIKFLDELEAHNGRDDRNTAKA